MDEIEEIQRIAASLRAELSRLAARGLTQLPAARAPGAARPAEAAKAGGAPPARPAAATVPGPTRESGGAARLAEIRADLGECRRCKLHSGRTKLVFGVGNPDADLVFVGEGPGYHEDQEGEPFVGDAGQLLDRMIAAMGFRREDVYIANIVKCRPPGNRNPEPDEIAACEPFLKQQLAALRPRMIVALGKFAAQTLLGEPQAPISALRGRFHGYEGIQVMPTYHPAYLLRTPSQKRVVWEDLQLVLQELGRLGIEPPHPPAR